MTRPSVAVVMLASLVVVLGAGEARAEPPAPARSAVPAPAPRAGAPVRFVAAGFGASGVVEIAGLGRAVVWWEAVGASGFDHDAATANRSWSRGVPSAYVIEATADGTAWSVLLEVRQNSYVTGAHVVDLAGKKAVRMRLVGPVLRDGPVDLAVHDARAGIDDQWLFLGDSNTELVFSGRRAGDEGRFGHDVKARDPGRWPIALNGGISGGALDHMLRTRSGTWSDDAGDGTGPLLYPDARGRPQPLMRRWMGEFAGRFVSIGIGTNDVNAISWRAATPEDLDRMERKVSALVEEALAAGKTVILPTLRWCRTNPYTAQNLEAWNRRLWESVLPRYPRVLRGPDLYAASVDRPDLLEPDGTHPNAAGIATSRRLWVEWALANVYGRAERRPPGAAPAAASASPR